MRKHLIFLLLFLTAYLLSAENLDIKSEDILIEQSLEGGYDLWIKKKPDVQSVLLVESTKDPEGESATYALRNPEYHPTTGDERRILNGEFLESAEKGRYYLIDSTPETHPELGQAFHIFIPYIVIYGYPWSRSGETQVLDGTFINIRAFSTKHADYRGIYRDNPFKVRVTQKPMEGPPEDNYMTDTVDSYTEIAEKGGGSAQYSTGEDDILDKIRTALGDTTSPSLDMVIALDTTQSMLNDIDAIRENLVPFLKEHIRGFDTYRIGLLYYKDYMEEYVTQKIPFQNDLNSIQYSIDRARVYGGRDIPEAVYEALYGGIHNFDWKAETRLIVLIGDAPPHPRPRGVVTKEQVYTDAEKNNITLHTIILPQ